MNESSSYSGRYRELFAADATSGQLQTLTLATEITSGAFSATLGWTYDTDWRVAALSLNGSSLSFAYDGDGLLTRAGDLTISRHAQHGMPTATSLGALATTQAYTQFGEPSVYSASYGGSQLYSLSLTYDKLGRVSRKTETVLGVSTERSYEYDEANRLQTVKASGTTAVTLPGAGEVSYVVDAAGRRVGKKVNGTLTRSFVYQDALRIAAELDGNGVVRSRFIYGERPNVPEYMIRAGITYRLITDHLGSVRLVVSTSTGQIEQRIDYDEWGLSDSNPGFQPFGFAGGLYDPDTALVRFGARDYDASTGRWTSKDSIRFNGGNNTYAYVGGNPISRVDPNGLLGLDTLIDAGIGGLANGFVNGLNYSSQGCSFGKGFANGFIAGAVGGAVFSANPFAGGAVTGALTQSLNRGQSVQSFASAVPDIVWAAIVGGATGWAGGAAGNLAAARAGSPGLANALGALSGFTYGTQVNNWTNLGGAISGSSPSCGCK